MQVRAGFQQRIRQPGAGFDQVLAVVQEQEQALLLQVILQQSQSLRFCLQAHAHGAGNRLDNQLRLRQWRQLGKPDPIRVLLQ